MSQAVYVAFCESFVDSFQKFDELFKDCIVNVVHEWITGKYSSINYLAGFSALNCNNWQLSENENYKLHLQCHFVVHVLFT